jgi:hypothetical protein
MGKSTENINIGVYINGTGAAGSLKELGDEIRKFQNELNKLPIGTAEFNSKLEELHKKKAVFQNIKNEINQTQTSLTGLKDSWMKVAAAYTAVIAAGSGVIAFFKKAIEGAMEDERAERKLTLALDGNTEAARRLLKFKGMLWEKTTLGEEEIMKLINYGLAMGRTELDTRKLVQASIALSNATGGQLDVMGAMDQLNKTYTGDLGRIKKYVGDLTHEQLKNGEAIDVVNTKYVKFLSEGMDTASGKVIMFKKAWEEFGDTVGSKVLPVLGHLMTFINAELFDNLDSQISIVQTSILKLEIAKKTASSGEAKIIDRNIQEQRIKLNELENKQGWEKIEQIKAETSAMRKNDVGSKWYGPSEAQLKEEERIYEENVKKAEEHAKYLEKIHKDLQETIVSGIQNEHDRELKMTELDYKQKIEAIKGHTKEEEALRLALKQAYNRKIEDINKKYSDEELKKLITAEKAKWEARINADDKGSAEWFLDIKSFLEMQMRWEMDQVGNVENAEQLKYEIRQKYLSLTQALEQDFQGTGKTEKSQGRRSEGGQSLIQSSGVDKSDGGLSEKIFLLEMARDRELEIAQDSSDRQQQIWREYYDAVGQMVVENLGKTIDLASTVVSQLEGVNSAINNYEDAQLAKDLSANDQKKANLKKQLDNKLISQKNYDKQVEKIDKESAAKKKALEIEQAKRQHKIAIMNAVIGLAQAVLNGLNTQPFMPLGIIMGALAAVLGGIQLGYVLSTPVPTASKGRYNVIGQEDGKRYDNVPYEESFNGVPDNAMLIRETGKELVVDPVRTQKLMINYPEVIDAIKYDRFDRVPQRASGQYPSSISVSEQTGRSTIGFDSETLLALKEFNDNIRRPIIAKMSYDHFQEELQKVEDINTDVSR